MTQLTSAEIMLVAALVVGLATVCQVVAPRLRVPALILLLPVGFAFGLVAPQWRLDAILGQAFPAAVDLIVAVILFKGGLDLGAVPLAANHRRLVHRLVWWGGAVTGVAGAVAAHFIMGMDWPIAAMLGAIVIVSGPTVVTPILDFAKIGGRVRGVLQWEGTLLDPIGALAAVVVFQVVRASGAESLGQAVGSFLTGLLVGVVAAALGVVLFVVGGRLVRGNTLLGTQVLLGSVITASGLANFVSDDAGLLAALLMGMAAPRIAERFHASLADSRPFFETIVSFGIGVLFIAISALVPLSALMSILLPALVMTAVLILVVRPLVVAVVTARSDLTRPERVFIASMDPRGIVAAASASSIGAALVGLKVPGAEQLLPAAFIIVAVTVAVYGLAAVPLARVLKLGGTSPHQQPNATVTSSSG